MTMLNPAGFSDFMFGVGTSKSPSRTADWETEISFPHTCSTRVNWGWLGPLRAALASRPSNASATAKAEDLGPTLNEFRTKAAIFRTEVGGAPTVSVGLADLATCFFRLSTGCGFA